MNDCQIKYEWQKLYVLGSFQFVVTVTIILSALVQCSLLLAKTTKLPFLVIYFSHLVSFTPMR